jgi:DnaJ-like protein
VRALHSWYHENTEGCVWPKQGWSKAMGTQPDDYQVLGVAGTASAEEIKTAFQKLVTDFHAAGKPKNIDDVEWLRRVVHAYHALSGNTSDANEKPNFGYDSEALDDINRAVDNEIARQKLATLSDGLGNTLAEIVWAYLKLRNI